MDSRYQMRVSGTYHPRLTKPRKQRRAPQPRETAQIGNFVDKLYIYLGIFLCPCEATITIKITIMYYNIRKMTHHKIKLIL